MFKYKKNVKLLADELLSNKTISYDKIKKIILHKKIENSLSYLNKIRLNY